MGHWPSFPNSYLPAVEWGYRSLLVNRNAYLAQGERALIVRTNYNSENLTPPSLFTLKGPERASCGVHILLGSPTEGGTDREEESHL